MVCPPAGISAGEFGVGARKRTRALGVKISNPPFDILKKQGRALRHPIEDGCNWASEFQFSQLIFLWCKAGCSSIRAIENPSRLGKADTAGIKTLRRIIDFFVLTLLFIGSMCVNLCASVVYSCRNCNLFPGNCGTPL